MIIAEIYRLFKGSICPFANSLFISVWIIACKVWFLFAYPNLNGLFSASLFDAVLSMKFHVLRQIFEPILTRIMLRGEHSGVLYAHLYLD